MTSVLETEKAGPPTPTPRPVRWLSPFQLLGYLGISHTDTLQRPGEVLVLARLLVLLGNQVRSKVCLASITFGVVGREFRRSGGHSGLSSFLESRLGFGLQAW